MSRVYLQWKDRDKLGKRKPEKIDENKRKAQREKFCKCKQCGGQMTYVEGTNIFLCQNEVETKEGKKTCGAINLVDDRYMDYVNYLFKEVK